jgi:hypothetical protein
MTSERLPSSIDDVAEFLEARVKEAEAADEGERLSLCLATEQMNFDHLAPDVFRKNLAQQAVSAVAYYLREEHFRTAPARHGAVMALNRLRSETKGGLPTI